MRRLSPAELDWYGHVPADVARRVRIVPVPLLGPGADGMTLGRFVLLRRRVGAARAADRASVLVAHELVHTRQWAELGVARFLSQYLRCYVANLARLRRHRAAYLAIPLEVEARAEAARWAGDYAGRRPSPPGPPGQDAGSGSGAGGGTG